MKTLVRTALGLAVVLAWWTLSGDTISTSKAEDKIPSIVWGGGGGTLAIEAETTTPAQMRVSFGRDGDGDFDSLETYEEVAAGTHRWSIDVPKDASGYVELGATQPKPGDRLHFRILVNGRTVFEDADQLEKPLEPGYAFFVQAYFDDYATGTLGQD